MQTIFCSLRLCVVCVCITCAISLVADLEIEPKKVPKKGEWTNITCKCGVTKIPKKYSDSLSLSIFFPHWPFFSFDSNEQYAHACTLHILEIGKILMHVAKFLTWSTLSSSLYCRPKINIISEMRQQKHQWVDRTIHSILRQTFFFFFFLLLFFPLPCICVSFLFFLRMHFVVDSFMHYNPLSLSNDKLSKYPHAFLNSIMIFV